MHRSYVSLALIAGSSLSVAAPVVAQSIIPGGNAGTIVAPGLPRETLIQGGTQAGSNLFHQFQQFSLGQGDKANFLINPTVGNIFSRISGGQASLINGTLQVSGGNANLFLINPAGIIFGQSARLNLPASFVATTAEALEFDRSRWLTGNTNINPELTGSVTGYGWLSTTPGSVVNAGNLAVTAGQSVMLSGGTVINTGTIAAPGGKVTIAAVPGENVLRVSQDSQVLSLDLPLMGNMPFQGLPQAPTPARLPALLAGRDVAEATGITIVDGKVQLSATSPPIALESNQSLIGGSIAGASIDITGQKIALQAATLQASQPQGGGTIRVGGDYQGQGNLPRSQQVQVDAASQLQADATVAGNGGRVIVWSDGDTQFAGSASARGQGDNGNGGLIETSGKQTLDVNGARVNASAPAGKPGEWLLDPSNITIANGGPGAIVGGTFDPATTSVIAPGTIAAALDSGTNVNITTAGGTGGNGDIRLTDSINQTGGGAATLTISSRRFNRTGSASINLSSTGSLTFNINTVNPELPAPSGSIQNAINVIGAVAGDRQINLGTGVFTGPPGNTLITVNKNVTISGADYTPDNIPTTYINGSNTARPFIITAGSRVTLRNLGIQNGFASATESGGGILNAGQLTIERSAIFDSRSGVNGGGINSSSPTSSLVMNNVTLVNNRATVNGGGGFFNGNTVFNGGTIDGNQAGVSGGGVYNEGDLTISASRVSNNQAPNGGGIYSNGINAKLNVVDFLLRDNRATNGSGGSVFSQGGSIKFFRGGLDGNRATDRGGAIYAAGGTVDLSTLSVSNNEANYGGGIEINNIADAQLQGVTINNNRALTQAGGGINISGTSNVRLSQAILRQNQSASNGGGLAAQAENFFAGTIDITDSTIAQNIAGANGGGIDVNPTFLADGSLNLNRVTLNDNQAGADGGAISVGTLAPTSLTNVTIVQNRADRNGGGLNSTNGDFTLNHVTIANNQADANSDGLGLGGGIYNLALPTVQLQNTIVAKNRAADRFDVSGAFDDQGNNLIGIVDGGSGFAASTLIGNSAAPIEPLLSALGDYDGLTETVALLPGSLALDAANATGPTSDQRGINRIGPAADIGAFESRGFTLSSSGSGQSSLIDTAFSNPLELTVLSAFGEPVDGGQITFTAPITGSSLILSPNPQILTIASGRTSLTANANAIAGDYDVLATANALPSTAFRLTNTAPPLPPPPSPVTPPPPPVTPLPPPPTTQTPPLLPTRAPIRRESLPIYPIQLKIDGSDSESQITSQLDGLDMRFRQDYIQQFGSIIAAQKVTEVETGKLLTNLDRQRGLRSAVIYAMFVSQEFAPQTTDSNDAKSAAIPSLLRATERRDDDRLELIFITGEGKLYRRSTPYQRHEVEATIAQFQLVNSDVENISSTEVFGKAMQQWLFEPVRQDLEKLKINGLMYVLDQGLRSLPIAAMRDGQQALIERFTMAVIPSLGMLDRQQSILRNQTTLVAGASKFTELSALPAVPDELAMIQRQGFPGTALLNETFTIANLKRQQQELQPGILHLATHADFNSGSPNNSAIQFFDQSLPLSQIDRLNLRNSNLELLILSACNTATGDPKAELGFTGIASLTGVRTALGSLWSISDLGTYAFMSEFYGHLAKTPSRSETLRLTQLGMQQGKVRIEQGHLVTSHGKRQLPRILASQTAQTFSHPYFWSGFTMVGNPW